MIRKGEEMPEENLSLVKNIYKKFNDREYASVLEHFGKDFEWLAADNSPLADQSPYRGVEAVRDGVFARIAGGFERLTVKIDELIDAGDKVIVLGYYEGNFAGSSKPLHAQLAHIWTICEGKAIKFQQYLDTLKVQQDAAA